MPSDRNPLLAALLTTSTVVTVALVWFGLTNVQQQSAVERQQAWERLENGADAIAASVGAKLAEAGERLSGWISSSRSMVPGVDGAVVIAGSEGRFEVAPRGGVPFVPAEIQLEASSQVFDAAEAIELAGNQRARAAEMYTKLSRQSDARIRAESLLRLGRVLRNSRNFEAAKAAFAELAQFGDLSVSGLPAELAALEGQRLTRAAAGEKAGERRIALQIARSIDAGRWLLARGTAEFYRELSAEPKPESWILAEALARIWQTEVKGHMPASGLRVVEVEGRPVLAIWRSSGPRSAVLATFTGTFVARSVGRGLQYQLADAAGRRIAGAASVPPQTVARVIGDPQNPWMMRVWPGGAVPGGRSRLGPQFLLAMLGVVIAFLWATVYFMARAIRREARVARLQSDFVAAVSHEFRSPLTTVRQLSEMLEMDQVPSEERRRKYYYVLAGEARRLQRLVETLLNFGKMEAGAQQYHFEKVEVGELVGRAVRDATGEETQATARLRIAGPDPPMLVIGDADALTVALRNLVDNGLKYSPASEAVEVRWGNQDGRVSISVADRGPGIPKQEQEAIFQRFVRGRAATDASIKGTGVGLAMVRHIVTAHGGKIRLESEPGRGTTFTIVLTEAR